MKTWKNKISPAKLAFSIINMLLYPAIILAIAGDWLWTEGWIYIVWFLAFSISIKIYLYCKDPELLAERFKVSAKEKEGKQKGWDKYFLLAIVLGYLIWIIVIPLDAKRFMWSPIFPLWIKIAGGTGMLLSTFFLARSFTDNTYLSPTVRIQKERNQHVVSTGVYGFVRHPMYLGSILMFLSTPLMLNSIDGIIIGGVISIILCLRIIGEEKMLVEELEGYTDYKNKVKYRLIPFIW